MSTRNEGADGYSEPTAHDPRDTAERDPHRFDTRAPDLNGNGQPPAAPTQPGGIGGLAGLSNFAGMGSYTPTTHPQAEEPAPAQPEPSDLASYTPEYTPPEAPNRPSVFPDLDNAAAQTSSFDSFRTEEPRYEPPHYEEPRFEQTRFEEPQYEEPRYEEPRVAQPQYQEEPRYEEPQYEEPTAPEPRYDESRFADPVPDPHQRVEPQFNETSFDPSRFEPAPLGAPSFDDPHQAESPFEQPTRQEHRFEPAPAENERPVESPRFEPSPAYQAILGADEEPSEPAHDYTADRRFDSAYDQRDEPAPVGDFGTVAADDLPQSFRSGEPHFGAQPDFAAEPPTYEQHEPAAEFAAYPAASAGEPAFGAAEPDLPEHGFDPATGVQQYEARYDRHPEIPLGGYDNQSDAAEDAGKQPYFHETEEGDADFLGEEKAAAGGKKRKFLMVACGLVGALALGGTLAYAYKTSGTFLGGSDTPPIIEADSRPVKVAPETPGGKEFPHKNKLIYDRLSGEDRTETEKLVSRQEDVIDEVQRALTAREAPGTAAAPEAPTNPGLAPNQGRAETPAVSPEDGPRKVKTLVVRPDGTIVRQAVPETPAPAAPSPAQPAPAKPEPPAAAPRVAAAPVTRVEPEAAAPAAAAEQSGDATPPPTRKPRETAVASARPTPAPATPAAPAAQAGEYVVQVGARRSQTAALAGFADLQQKYPRILSGYRPIIQKADLGNKGTWYRLRIGPLETKTAAADLCKKLKSAGMRSCLVNTR